MNRISSTIFTRASSSVHQRLLHHRLCILTIVPSACDFVTSVRRENLPELNSRQFSFVLTARAQGHPIIRSGRRQVIYRIHAEWMNWTISNIRTRQVFRHWRKIYLCFSALKRARLFCSRQLIRLHRITKCASSSIGICTFVLHQRLCVSSLSFVNLWIFTTRSELHSARCTQTLTGEESWVLCLTQLTVRRTFGFIHRNHHPSVWSTKRRASEPNRNHCNPEPEAARDSSACLQRRRHRHRHQSWLLQNYKTTSSNLQTTMIIAATTISILWVGKSVESSVGEFCCTYKRVGYLIPHP